MVGAGLWITRGRLWAFDQSPNFSKFTAPLQGLGPAGIPVAVPNTSMYTGVDYYEIQAAEYRQVLHPDFYSIYGQGFKGTKFWGYADVTDGKKANHRYLGGLIVAQRDRPVRLRALNKLPGGPKKQFPHPVAVDHTMPVDYAGIGTVDPVDYENRIAVHLHGGHTPWMSDGGPFHWIGRNNSVKGPSVVNWLPDVAGILTDDYYYPMDQSARLMWYHDHAVGITHYNAYVGLASGFLLQDQTEAVMIGAGMIPDGTKLIPLVLQDKSFVPVGGPKDEGVRGGPGDLWYPSLYEKFPPPTGRWEWGGATFPTKGFLDPPVPSTIPEFFADTTVINGSLYPFLELEPRRYRFLMLNANQARFYNLGLYKEDLSNPGEIKTVTLSGSVVPIPDINYAGPAIIQIGTEGGFLPAAVTLNNPPVPFSAAFNDAGDLFPGSISGNLMLGCGERADVMIDFSNVTPGSRLILYNDAPGPFPGGDDRNDYYTDAPDFTLAGGAATPKVGKGPNTRTLMQIRIVARVGAADIKTTLVLPPMDPQPLYADIGVVPSWVSKPSLTPAAAGVDYVRDLTLNEYFDQWGRLVQQLGTNVPRTDLVEGTTFRRDYFPEPATETPNLDAVEVWRIFNLTADTHPIHFHLVNVQVLSRQAFDVGNYDGTPTFIDDPWAPDPNEQGWKETVRMNPGECTTVIMKFDLAPIPTEVTVPKGKGKGKGKGNQVTYPVGPTPTSPRTDPRGYEYVWHCHILEHEEHDMMRPLVVIP
jgi:spore coat protein A